ncbi:MAG TPA: SCO2525 family SAM-dependent methyltransferase [Rugosimonospora sp.]|nr:SCO2525 family SAM-dependent methyltransferase [Rugosimonospora sp.]
MTQTMPSDADTAVQPPADTAQDVVDPSGGANDDYPWDDFDPVAYFNHNYRYLRDDDREILGRVRDFFAPLELPADARGIDVGTGSNLYPALSMLPLCRRILLWERSRSNVTWLRKQVRRHGPAWDQFWDHLAEADRYRRMREPWTELPERAKVRCANVFQLPEQEFDVGTMFFVAESISTRVHQFHDAVYRFLGSLRPGAPFAAAFMHNSKGYRVGEIDFPAVPVSTTHVRQCVADAGRIHELYEIDKGDKPLRDDYDGMILVTGWRR